METIRIAKDIAVMLMCVTIFTVIFWTLRNPELIGQWEARKDIAYDTAMGSHYSDQ